MPPRKRAPARRRSRPRPVTRILNCRPSPKVEDDWTFEHAAEADVVAAAAPLPATKDLRAAWWTINDQGSTGSCVGWATADGLLRYGFVKASRLARDELLSPRFVWMAAKETDALTTRPTTFIESEGTTLKGALDVARKFGVVRDSVLPFASGSLYEGDTKTFYAVATQLRISAYFNLGLNLANWRTWLATKGPILTRLEVDRTWDDAGTTAGNLDDYQPDTKRGGHAVAVVGYKPGRFIIRNSWGTSWGDKGFGYASPGYAAEAFTEAYGAGI